VAAKRLRNTDDMNTRVVHILPLLLTLTLGACSQTPDALSASDRKGWFADRIRELATQGIMDPTSVGRDLGLKFVSASKEQVTQPPDCSNPYSDKSRVETLYTATDTWFRPMPGGVSHQYLPAFFINKAAFVGDPVFQYDIKAQRNYTGNRTIGQYSSAHLAFTNVPAFSCIKPGDLRRAFPALRPVPASDGAIEFTVDGDRGEKDGSTATFHYRAGAACLLSVDIEQSPRLGGRYHWALARFEHCRLAADHDFCVSHPPFTWSQGDIIDHRDQHAIAVCGTLDSFYQQETSGGSMVQRPHRPRFQSSPCEGL
jgi:hypothetical protein